MSTSPTPISEASVGNGQLLTTSSPQFLIQWRRLLLATLVVYAVVQVFWITTTPLKMVARPDSLPNHSQTPILLGTGPDEDEHFLYILSIANRGELPQPTAQWRKSPDEYLSHEGQHPPLFYWIVAGILRSCKAVGLSDRAVWYALRGFNGVCGAVIVWLLARASLLVFPRRPFIALAMAPAVAFVPIFGYMTGTLSNLPLEMVFTSAGWLLLVELVREIRILNSKSGLALGAAFGLAAATRITSLMWLPALLILLGYIVSLSAGTQRKAAMVGAFASLFLLAVLAFPWLLHSKIEYGTFLFRSDYRPILGNITLLQWMSDPSQLIHIVNSTIQVRVEPVTILLWYTSSSWMPFWLAQYALPGFPNTAGAFQSPFLIIIVLTGLILLRHSSQSRQASTQQQENGDQAGRMLLWAAGVSLTVSVSALLLQEFYVDVVMNSYAGRYTISVMAASSLLVLFALSTLIPQRQRSVMIGAYAVGFVMLGLNIGTMLLIRQFYTWSAGL